jgi:hypothetical protein
VVVQLEDGSDSSSIELMQTPLWKRAEYLHKVAHSLKENSQVSHAQCFIQPEPSAMIKEVQSLLGNHAQPDP